MKYSFLFLLFISYFSVCLSQEKKVYIFQENFRLSEDDYNNLINDKLIKNSIEISIYDSVNSNDTIFYNINIVEKGAFQKDKKVTIQTRDYNPDYIEDFKTAFALNSEGNNSTNNFYLNDDNILIEYSVYDLKKNHKDQLDFKLEEDYTIYKNGEIVIVFRSINGHVILIKQVEPILLQKIKSLPNKLSVDNLNGRMVCNYFVLLKQFKQSFPSRFEFEKQHPIFKEIRETKWDKAFSVFSKIEDSNRYHKIKKQITDSHLEGNLPIYDYRLPMVDAPGPSASKLNSK
jgi:hypothetical protein